MAFYSQERSLTGSRIFLSLGQNTLMFVSWTQRLSLICPNSCILNLLCGISITWPSIAMWLNSLASRSRVRESSESLDDSFVSYIFFPYFVVWDFMFSLICRIWMTVQRRAVVYFSPSCPNTVSPFSRFCKSAGLNTTDLKNIVS